MDRQKITLILSAPTKTNCQRCILIEFWFFESLWTLYRMLTFHHHHIANTTNIASTFSFINIILYDRFRAGTNVVEGHGVRVASRIATVFIVIDWHYYTNFAFRRTVTIAKNVRGKFVDAFLRVQSNCSTRFVWIASGDAFAGF